MAFLHLYNGETTIATLDGHEPSAGERYDAVKRVVMLFGLDAAMVLRHDIEEARQAVVAERTAYWTAQGYTADEAATAAWLEVSA